jgi:hypothetical protein
VARVIIIIIIIVIVRAVVETVIPWKTSNLLASLATISYSRWTTHHDVIEKHDDIDI